MKIARLRVVMLVLGDLIVLAGILLAVTVLYRLAGGDYSVIAYLRLWPVPLTYLLTAATIRLYHGNPFYPGLPLPPVEELRRSFFAVSLTFLLTFAYLAFTGRMYHYSRFVLVISWSV